MWQARLTELRPRQVYRYELTRGDEPLSWSETLGAWQDDAAFRSFFISLLRDAPLDAFFWETPSLTKARLELRFEFVLVDAPALNGARVDAASFRNQFDAGANRSVIAFDNLGRDARLIAPVPDTSRPGDCAHLATFTRSAGLEVQHDLWSLVGMEVSRRVGAEPLWVSTSGLGVYWLHVRLDRAPKYYTHAAYRAR